QLVRWGIALAALALLVRYAVPWFAAHQVRAILAPYVVDMEELELRVNVFEGSFELKDVQLRLPAGMYPRAPMLRGRVDAFSVTGISVRRLLFSKTFAMEEVRIRAGNIEVEVEPRDTLPPLAEGKGEKVERTILIGRFDLRFTALTCRTLGADSVQYTADSVQLAGREFHLDLHGADPYPHFADASVVLSGFQLAHSKGYVLRVANAAVANKGATVLVRDLAFAPTTELKAYGTAMAYERDVFDVHCDTIALAGFDLEQWYATKMLHARTLHIARAEALVLRDKTLRDGPSVYKPLLGKLVRALPPGSGADTIVVSNSSVTYLERNDRDRGFARIPFTGMDALLTGVRNAKEGPATLVLDAKATVFGTTPLSLKLTTDLHDSTDRFVADAHMGHLAFPVMNMAASPMFDVKATGGHMYAMDFHMEANDRRAHGTVAMVYDGIKLSGGGIEQDRTLGKLFSVAINALVRNNSSGAQGKERVGTFAFERQRDRSIFNYLWSGLREGSKSMLLPKVMTK
ncbi:MAG: hypothetical protein R2818_13435, partial [Flavobacteriales bacterium]